ncbi:unnamed protein product [Cuscuta europaea]|uniref:Late embryogenesis abundant protein LEA-2 subgroup domain-containing protein n=1 Tax=Cuscuta europaea TaxID=41803 RepID=A0A9P0YWW7_CUSEU|nr:unnamed protein product [Cuscuta europaea]
MKGAQLNGAYYGPTIPPPANTYHRHSTRGGGCNPISCLCNCIFNCICQLICTAVVIFGVLVVVLWLLFRPNQLKFYVDEATLTQFDLPPTNNTLHYDLAVNMSIRNPNKRIGVYYDSIEASAFYKGKRLSTQENVATFYQGHKNTTSFKIQPFRGSQVVSINAGDRASYDEEKKAGAYEIDVKLRMKLRLKLGRWMKIGKGKTRIECNLKVPLKPAASSTKFEKTRCDLDW